MIKQEGMLRPFRGISAMMVGAGPAHALYFSCYEFLKDKFASLRSSPHNSHLVYAYAGVFATILHDGIMNPAEGTLFFFFLLFSRFLTLKKFFFSGQTEDADA